MFGHKADPNTRNFRYGALEPTIGIEQVREQLHLAHKYRNTLVEIELRRRKTTEETMAKIVPSIDRLEWELVAAELDHEEAVQLILTTNKMLRRRGETPEHRKAATTTKKALVAAKRALWAARKEAKESTKVQHALKKINTAAHDEAKTARAANGLYWGTYLSIENSVKTSSGRPPRFHSWDGNGKLSVQIQHGLSISDAFSCKDNRIRIEPIPENAWEHGHPRRERYTKLWMRVGSNGRDPIWAVIPLQLHRPFPKGSSIRWISLLARRYGTKTRWYVVFTLAGAPDLRLSAEDGVVDVRVGWKAMESGGLRVASWKGNDGNDGELILPARDVSRWEKAEDLRSIRDKRFSVAIDAMQAWLAKEKNLPEWMVEATKTIHAWRSCARLASLVWRWKNERFDGDTSIFQEMESWRKKDKHLYEWESNQRRKACAWRDDTLRVFANTLAYEYRTLRINDRDWSKVARRAEAGEKEKNVSDTARRNRTIASPGRLCAILIERFGARSETLLKSEDQVMAMPSKGLRTFDDDEEAIPVDVNADSQSVVSEVL